METDTVPATKRRQKPRMPVPRGSLAAKHRGCGLTDAITVAGDHTFEYLQPGQEVVLMQPMKIHQLIPGGNEIVLMGPAGTRRVRRDEIVRHVEITR